METDTQQSTERQIAYMVTIKDLSEGKYITQEGWEPNFVHTQWDGKISRAHLVGTIIDKRESPQTLVIDDSTATVELRSFDGIPAFTGHKVGDLVRVIGRPRIFNDSIYIVPEIIATLPDPSWFALHKEFLSYFAKERKIRDLEPQADLEHTDIQEENDDDQLLSLIDQLDEGKGVSIAVAAEKIKESFGFDDPHAVIDRLLLHGEVFEIRKGEIKVLH
jgi:RPA family protein